MLIEFGKECLMFVIALFYDLIAIILSVLANSLFIYLC